VTIAGLVRFYTFRSCTISRSTEIGETSKTPASLVAFKFLRQRQAENLSPRWVRLLNYTIKKTQGKDWYFLAADVMLASGPPDYRLPFSAKYARMVF
jgi:hypothetical protein